MKARGNRDPSTSGWTCEQAGHELTTERLVVRTVRPDELDAVLATIDDEVIRWQGFPSTRDDLRKQIAFEIRDGVVPFPYHETLGIFDRADETLIGLRVLDERVVDGTSHGLTVSSWLGREWRGKGLGTEELRALLSFVHNHLAMAIVAAGVEETNEAALIQHRAAGFEAFATRPNRLPDGRTASTVWMQHIQKWTKGRCGHRPRRAKVVYAKSVADILAAAFRVAASFDHKEIGTEDLALACAHEEIRGEIKRELPTLAELTSRLGWTTVNRPNVNVERPLANDVSDLLGEVVRAQALLEKFPIDGTNLYDALVASDTAGGRLLRAASEPHA